MFPSTRRRIVAGKRLTLSHEMPHIATEKVRLWPRALVEMAHSGGALVSWQVGSKSEAVAAAAAGCDIIVAQGVEAGGHVRGTVDTMTLLSQVTGRSMCLCLRPAGSVLAARWRRRSQPERTAYAWGRAF